MRLRCPHCKEVTSDRARSFPHCIRCGEQLAQCRRCLHFDSKTGLCRSAHLDHPTPVDPHQVPTCGFYLSRLDVTRDPVRRVLPWAAALLAISLLTAVGLWVWSGVRAKPEAAQTVSIAFIGNRDLSGNTPSVFYINVRNTGRERIRRLNIHLGADLFNACEIVSLKPKHLGRALDAEKQMYCYDFGPLDVGKTLQVELTVQAQTERLRRVAWEAEAYGDSGECLAQTTNVVNIVP